ncbi:MAG: hypothetical protein WD060_12795 [Pirellulales bacterium]
MAAGFLADWPDAPRAFADPIASVCPGAKNRPICSGCGQKRPGYDRLAARRCEFVPLWNIAAFFMYSMRRVNCPNCGVIGI